MAKKIGRQPVEIYRAYLLSCKDPIKKVILFLGVVFQKLKVKVTQISNFPFIF